MSGVNAWTPLGPDCIIDGQMDDSGYRAPVSGRVTCIVLDGGTVYVGTAGGGVWRSEDTGISWTPLDDQQASLAIGAMVLDAAAHRLYIGTGEGNSGGRMQHGQGLLIYDTQAKTFLPRVAAIPTAQPRSKTLRSSCMLIEPAVGPSPQRLWLGTNDGLYYSEDAGQTWLKSVLTGASNQAVSSLVRVQDAGGAQMLAGWWGSFIRYAGGGSTTHNGGVFRKRPDQGFDALPKAVEPSNQLTNQAVGRTGMAVAPSNPQRVYVLMASNASADFYGLFRSDDGGQTWSKRHLPGDAAHPLKQSSYNHTLAVHPTDPDTLIVGEKALWRSSNGGDDWTRISAPSGTSPGTHSDQHAVVYDPAQPDRVWLGNDGGVWLSEDGGTTWHHRNRGLNTLQYYALVHHGAAEAVLLAGAQDNGTQRFTGHAGWNLVGFGDGFFCGIDSVNPQYWYSSYVYRNSAGKLSGIQRSDTAGTISSWAYVTDGMDGTEYANQQSEPFYVPFILDPVTPATLYLGTTRLWRSTDRGTTWTAVANLGGTVFSTATSVLPNKPSSWEGISNLCVDPNDTNVVYVGCRDGRVFQVILTLGANQAVVDAVWSVAAMPPLPPAWDTLAAGEPPQVSQSYCADLAVAKHPTVVPIAQRPVYVAFGHDYVSSSLPQHVFAGRIWAVDFSNRMAPVWTPLGKSQLDGIMPELPNLPHQQNPINALAFDPNDPQRLFVGCHKGVFETTDGGSTWHNFGQGLPNAPVVDLQLHPTHRLLRAATMGRSVWERPIDVIAAPDVSTADVFIRDNITDLGRYATPDDGIDPLNPPAHVRWFEGVDIKVDSKTFMGDFETPVSTQDYSANGPLDYIGFQQLPSDDLVRGRQSRIHVQLSNRGPQKATAVVVRVYWAHMNGENAPALPASFWANFPNSAPGGDNAWVAVAPAVTLTELPVGAPRVASFDFQPPDESTDIVLLAVMSCAEDPLNGSGTDLATVVRDNKHLAVRRVNVAYGTAEIVITLLAVAGVVAGVAVAAAAAG